MRVSEIFEAVVPGASGKAALVAGDGAPGRREEAFESVLVGIGPAEMPPARPSRHAGGAELPRPPAMAFAALAGSPAMESAGPRAAGGPQGDADPLPLPAPARPSEAAAAALDDALASALALRRQAEAVADATTTPLAGLTLGPPPPHPAPGELRATVGGAAGPGPALQEESALSGSLAGAVHLGLPWPVTAGQVPGVPHLLGLTGTEATAGPMARMPWQETATVPSPGPAAAAHAGAPALEVPGSGPAPVHGPAAGSRAGADALSFLGSEPVAAVYEPGREPRGLAAGGADPTLGALPRESDDARVSARWELPARWREEAAAPARGLGVGMSAEGEVLARIALSPGPSVGAGPPRDRAAWDVAPLAGDELTVAAPDRAGVAAAPVPPGSGAALGPDLTSGPVRADGGPVAVGPSGAALAAAPGSAGPAAPSEATRDAADRAPRREPAGSALPGGGTGASLGAPPPGAVAASAVAPTRRGSSGAEAGARGAGEKPMALEPSRAPGAEAAATPDRAPVASGLEVAVAPERGAAAVGPEMLPELPPAAAHGLGEAPSGMRDAATAPEARAETGARAAQQVAAALTASPEGVIELRLDPEELGPVRLGLAPGDGAITVQITAERGETLDLLRRHADQLARELRQAGYGEVSFQFGADTASGGGAAPRHGYAPPVAPGAGEAVPGDPAAAPAAGILPARRGLAAGALDLRL